MPIFRHAKAPKMGVLLVAIKRARVSCAKNVRLGAALERLRRVEINPAPALLVRCNDKLSPR